MDPVFGLAAAALKIALMEHSTGVHERMPVQSGSFTETYHVTVGFIHRVVQANTVYSDRYAILCQKIVARGNKLWPHNDSEDVGDAA